MKDRKNKEETFPEIRVYGEETDELVRSVVQERAGYFMNGRLKKGQKLLAEYRRAAEAVRKEELRRHEEWLGQLEKAAPQLADVYKEYADWQVSEGSIELEGIYLLGVHDGIRLMKGIRKL